MVLHPMQRPPYAASSIHHRHPLWHAALQGGCCSLDTPPGQQSLQPTTPATVQLAWGTYSHMLATALLAQPLVQQHHSSAIMAIRMLMLPKHTLLTAQQPSEQLSLVRASSAWPCSTCCQPWRVIQATSASRIHWCLHFW